MSAPAHGAAEEPHGADAAASVLPRLLAGAGEPGAISLRTHVQLHGPMPGQRGGGRRRARGTGDALIEEVARAGLLGRGGAAFPAATKMRAVADARGRAIVLANGAEAEPASRKDQTLLQTQPHLVIDGAVAAGEAVGADEAIIAVSELADASAESVGIAIEERELSGSPHAPRLRLVTVPGHFVAGQETAVVSYLNGAAAKPTFTPPLPFQSGVGGRPTLVSNVETLAHIALIARHGAAWFRELGTPAQPGSALVTLCGPVTHPGVYEIEQGASLASLIAAAGGAEEPLHGALLGGYSGTWIAAALLGGVALSDEHLAPHGATLGAGVVLLLSAEACPVAETVRLARWLSDQSARQCGPCLHGLDALAEALERLAAGGGGSRPAQRIERLSALVARRGACSHPDGAVNVTLSALEAFGPDFADHARNGPCEACTRPPQLPLPTRPLSGERRHAESARR